MDNFHKSFNSLYGIVMISICGFMIVGCSNGNSPTQTTVENCTCSFQDYKTQLNDDSKTYGKSIDDVVGSYPSVLFYNGHLYWYSSENEDKKIPRDYELIGTAQCILTKGWHCLINNWNQIYNGAQKYMEMEKMNTYM